MTVDPPIFVTPDRFVTIKLYATISGRSEQAIRHKISRGIWIEGREIIRDPEGRVMIDREGVQRWLKKGA
jgi:hypothetical protein